MDRIRWQGRLLSRRHQRSQSLLTQHAIWPLQQQTRTALDIHTRLCEVLQVACRARQATG
jgi:hypothetical protein